MRPEFWVMRVLIACEYDGSKKTKLTRKTDSSAPAMRGLGIRSQSESGKYLEMT